MSKKQLHHQKTLVEKILDKKHIPYQTVSFATEDRKSVVQGKGVDLGGLCNIKK